MTWRKVCRSCRKSVVTCYCACLTPFASRPRFFILIHPIEANRAIATGRMAHLSLTNSVLLEGVDFTQNEILNEALAAPKIRPLLLYPSPTATNLSVATGDEYRALFPVDEDVIIIVLDGTWRTARAMYRLSQNLHPLAAVCFTPTTPSQFQVRRQPEPHCYSTVEAIHEVLVIHDRHFPSKEARPQEKLLVPFAFMVNQQLEYQAINRAKPNYSRR